MASPGCSGPETGSLPTVLLYSPRGLGGARAARGLIAAPTQGVLQLKPSSPADWTL